MGRNTTFDGMMSYDGGGSNWRRKARVEAPRTDPTALKAKLAEAAAEKADAGGLYGRQAAKNKLKIEAGSPKEVAFNTAWAAITQAYEEQVVKPGLHREGVAQTAMHENLSFEMMYDGNKARLTDKAIEKLDRLVSKGLSKGKPFKMKPHPPAYVTLGDIFKDQVEHSLIDARDITQFENELAHALLGRVAGEGKGSVVVYSPSTPAGGLALDFSRRVKNGEGKYEYAFVMDDQTQRKLEHMLKNMPFGAVTTFTDMQFTSTRSHENSRRGR